MLVDVTPLRQAGAKLPEPAVRGAQPVRGDLVIATMPWRQARCPHEPLLPTALAYLRPAGGGPGELLPKLHDARVHRLDADQFVLVGVETVGAQYQHQEHPQAWWCRLVR